MADTLRFQELRHHFGQIDVPVRGVIEVELDRVQDSCGWGVPFFAFEGERTRLRQYNAKSDPAEFLEKRYQKNATSIDGLPGAVRGNAAEREG